MDFIKKLALAAIMIICAVFFVSPVDLMPGVAIDDIFYIIGAIASFVGEIKMLNAKET